MRVIRVFNTPHEIAKEAANIFILSAKESLVARGSFKVALSGGNSPIELYKILANEKSSQNLKWDKTYVFWSDERYVSLDDERSNAGKALHLMLSHVSVPKEQIFMMYEEGIGPEEAAKRYELSIYNIFESRSPRFDLILLGCGKDGHVGSIFPGSSVLDEKEKYVAAVRKGKDEPDRITMTPALINLARNIVFIVYGDEKALAVSEVLGGSGGGSDLPAKAIVPRDGKVYWLLDEKAASRFSTAKAKAPDSFCR